MPKPTDNLKTLRRYSTCIFEDLVIPERQRAIDRCIEQNERVMHFLQEAAETNPHPNRPMVVDFNLALAALKEASGGRPPGCLFPPQSGVPVHAVIKRRNDPETNRINWKIRMCRREMYTQCACAGQDPPVALVEAAVCWAFGELSIIKARLLFVSLNTTALYERCKVQVVTGRHPHRPALRLAARDWYRLLQRIHVFARVPRSSNKSSDGPYKQSDGQTDRLSASVR
ncbi:hypothetical protein PENSPDRAFT_663852 [Peniophora sp. CONT]|nr:hypothetical protein PENSPDRAFT_663852 [Peniophora sp. CONT]